MFLFEKMGRLSHQGSELVDGDHGKPSGSLEIASIGEKWELLTLDLTQ